MISFKIFNWQDHLVMKIEEFFIDMNENMIPPNNAESKNVEAKNIEAKNVER
jgi:hypothetical protein